jgi:hypothetical protein
MAHLISFTTARFDVRRETPNPINPIFGQAVLQWIGASLAGAGYEVSEPDAEDWGWYISAAGPAGVYMVGASGEPESEETPEVQWMVQVHKKRSFQETITGRNKLAPDDALTSTLAELVRGQMDFTAVEIDVEDDR